MSKKCSVCGALLNDGMRFCMMCGQPAETAVPITKVERKKKSKVVSIIFTCIFSILIVLLGSVAALGLSVRNVTKPENIQKIVAEVDFTEIRTGFLSGNKGKETLPELIHKNIPSRIRDYFPQKNIEKLVNKDFVKEFAATQVSQYIDDIFEQNGEGIIKVDEVEDFLEDNKKAINKAIEYDLPDVAYEEMVELMDKNDIEDVSDLSQYTKGNEEIFDRIKMICSYPTLIVCAVLSAVLAIIIICINRAAPRAFVATGLCAAIMALIQYVLISQVPTVQSVLEEALPFGSEFYNVLLSPLKAQGQTVATAFLIAFGVLALLAIISGVICRVKKNR